MGTCVRAMVAVGLSARASSTAFAGLAETSLG